MKISHISLIKLSRFILNKLSLITNPGDLFLLYFYCFLGYLPVISFRPIFISITFSVISAKLNVKSTAFVTSPGEASPIKIPLDEPILLQAASWPFTRTFFMPFP